MAVQKSQKGASTVAMKRKVYQQLLAYKLQWMIQKKGKHKTFFLLLQKEKIDNL